MTAESPRLRAPVRRALDAIHEHPQFELRSVAQDLPYKNCVEATVIAKPDLPNQWLAQGRSPNGILASEAVTLLLPPTFPLRAPRIYLRPDFNRELPHLFPCPSDQPPTPCLYDGDLSELQIQLGFSAVLEQLILWLENAALQRLVDRVQGWEPVRRDSLDDLLVADADHVRSFVRTNGGSAVFGLDYVRWPCQATGHTYRGMVQVNQLQLRPDAIDGWFFEREIPGLPGTAHGRSLAIVVWPAKGSSKRPCVTDRYLPETVFDLASLKARAVQYGCSQQLDRALEKLDKCSRGHRASHRQPVAVILIARRPFHLIGSESNLELCPYVVEMGESPVSKGSGGMAVRPAGHLEAIGVHLLRKMSGYSAKIDAVPWTKLGAGSLGSKIAIHMARAGYAPASIIDRAFLRPHNFARHALLPPPGSASFAINPRKAAALQGAIEGLGQSATAHFNDIVMALTNPAAISRLLPEDHWAVVNSTASSQVRERLASISTSERIPRLIETSLYARGEVGLLTVEGPNRNPDTADLALEAFHLMAEDEKLAARVFDDSGGMQRQQIGDGCGSMTMAMSDSRLSTMAAPMAEIVLQHQQEGLPDASGRVYLGRVQDDDVSVLWHNEEIAPWHVLWVDQARSWQVRISDRAHSKIVAESALHPEVETGGVLMGAFSEASQTFRVTDVLQAPPGSIRERDRFVLGTCDSTSNPDQYTPKGIHCLGTWHTHLSESGPSSQDLATAALVGEARVEPSVLLIRTPTAYRAALASRRLSPAEAQLSEGPIPAHDGGRR